MYRHHSVLFRHLLVGRIREYSKKSTKVQIMKCCSQIIFLFRKMIFTNYMLLNKRKSKKKKKKKKIIVFHIHTVSLAHCKLNRSQCFIHTHALTEIHRYIYPLYVYTITGCRRRYLEYISSHMHTYKQPHRHRGVFFFYMLK